MGDASLAALLSGAVSVCVLVAAYRWGGPARRERDRLHRLHSSEMHYIGTRHEWESRQYRSQARLARVTTIGTVAGVVGIALSIIGIAAANSDSERESAAPASTTTPTTNRASYDAPSTLMSPTSEMVLEQPSTTLVEVPAPLVELPARPSASPVELAKEIVLAERAIAGGRPDIPVALAGPFLQLAYRTLAAAPKLRAEAVDLLPESIQHISDATIGATHELLIGQKFATAYPSWSVVSPEPAEQLRAYYEQAQAQYGIDWSYLAAIHLIKTRMGRIVVPPSEAVPQGPMQFLVSTWQRYGNGDIQSNKDSVLAAARLLHENGGAGNISQALSRYDNSPNFLTAVRLYSEVLRTRPASFKQFYHWQVLYQHVDGLFVLMPGYPQSPPQRLA